MASLKLCSNRQCFLDKLYHGLRAPVRRLISISSVAVVMNNPNIIDLLFLDSSTADSYRSQTDSMPDDAEMLNTFAVCQERAYAYGSLHDPHGKVWVRLGVPIAFLIATSKEGTSS